MEKRSRTTGRRRLRWTPRAAEDIGDIITYLKKNSATAMGFGVRLRAALEQIVEQPESGPIAEGIRPEGWYRMLILERYKIIYRFEPEQQALIIMRVWHSRRAPWRLRVEE